MGLGWTEEAWFGFGFGFGFRLGLGLGLGLGQGGPRKPGCLARRVWSGVRYPKPQP